MKIKFPKYISNLNMLKSAFSSHLFGIAMLSMVVGISGHAATPASFATPKPQVAFHTSMGDFVVQLHPEHTPQTVKNFLQYVTSKHYDGTLFHRVIDGFMVQGGGYDQSYQLRPTRPPIAHEGQAAIAAGGARNVRGTIAMARTDDPHSASTQFFINVADNTRLDPVPIPDGDPVKRFEWMGQTLENVPRSALLNNSRLVGYTVFGHVISGMDTIDRIRQTATGPAGPFSQDAPVKPVIIFSATQLKPSP